MLNDKLGIYRMQSIDMLFLLAKRIGKCTRVRSIEVRYGSVNTITVLYIDSKTKKYEFSMFLGKLYIAR